MSYRRLCSGLMITSLIFIASCGSSDNSTAMSDAEFCQEINSFESRLDSIDPANDIDSAIEILRDLITKAPNDEVRQALIVIEPAFKELGQLDQDDPEAMSRFFDLMMSEEIVEAGGTLDRYSKDVCSFTDSSTSDSLG